MYIYIKPNNFFEQSPSWEANSLSSTPEIPRGTRTFKYRIHKISATGPWPDSHEQSPHSHVHFNIILLCMPAYPKWYLPIRFTCQKCVWISHLFYATCPVHLILPALIHPNIQRAGHSSRAV
jgi:hypothetical protein